MDRSSLSSEITLLYIFGWNYPVDKRSPWKCKFSDFQLFSWKLTKFLISFFKPSSSFSLTFASPFCVTTYLLCSFLAQHYIPWTKTVSESTNFKIFECFVKIHQIPRVIYETKSHFSFKVCIGLQYIDA